MRFIALLLPFFVLAACSTGIPLDQYAQQNQPRDDFTFCYGYSCKAQQKTGFSDQEWTQLRTIFKTKPAKDAAAERSKIAAAIAKMEKMIGAKTGTSHDLPEARGRKEDPAQMDCLDETVNTSRYLEFLAADGLLQFHRIANPVHRGYFLDGAWPHNTAVIEDTTTNTKYAVDSFYRANGEEPYIVPAQDWLKGWKPAGATQ